MSKEISATRRRFNIIDAIVIVLVILCIAAIVLRSQINNLLGIGERTSEYKLTFKVVSISETSYEYFDKEDVFWDAVYLNSPDMQLGIIEGTPEKMPATAYMTDSNGAPISVKYPEDSYIDVKGEIKCNGVFKDDGCFYLSGIYVISPGDVLKVHTVGLDFSLVVIDIGEFN